MRALVLAPSSLIKGAVLGLGATAAAALAPAIEATSAPPRAVLSRSVAEARARRSVPRAAFAGVLLLAAGGAFLALPSDRLAPAFAGLFGVVVGCALLTPAATVGLMALLGRPAGALFGVLGRMAARGVVAALSRTGVAVAALVIAVSVTVGVGVMIGSFRATVVDWLDQTLQADLYLSPPSAGPTPSGVHLDPAVVEAVRRAPGVERVDSLRRTTARLEPATLDGDRGLDAARRGAPVELAAFDLGPRGRRSFHLLAGDPRRAWAAVGGGSAVLVSEPLANRRHLTVGDRIRLPTASGERTFRVAGVYADFGRDPGAVLLDLATYRRLWRDRGLTALSVYAAPGVDREELAERLRRLAAPHQEVLVRSNRTLRETSMEIFDRTFAITSVLRLLAGLVAFAGVLSALMALQLERARELGVLRANGMTPGQVWQLVTSQTGLMGLAAGLLAVPVGLVLAAIMIFVINRRSFGWTLQMQVAPEILLQAVALAVAAALVAGLYPAWRMARTRPAAALREE